MTYQLLLDKDGNPTSGVKRTNTDGSVSYIPDCADNADWIAYQLWLSLGHTPNPA